MRNFRNGFLSSIGFRSCGPCTKRTSLQRGWPPKIRKNCQDIRYQPHCLFDTASLVQVKKGWLSSNSESSSCRLISRHCHVSHAQMHADFRSKIQINNQIWSSCFWRFVILVMLILVGHFVIHFDMVAELVRTKVHKIRRIIRSMTKTTITSSSSGEKRRFKWDFHLQRLSRKARARPSQKAKVSGPLGHGKISRTPVGVKVRKAKKGQKGSKSGKGKSACSICGKSGHTSNQCWWNGEQEGWSSEGSVQQPKGSSGSQYSKEVYNIHQYPQDQPVQTLPPDQLRGFRDLRPQAQQQQCQNQSQASTQCRSIATVLSSSDQVGGFSGQRLNINCQIISLIHAILILESWGKKLCVIPILNRFRFTQSPSGTMGSTH